MKWIKRYIYDVKRRLPEAIKNDVEEELISQINDMLADDDSEENIKRVLSKLGNPKLLANSYRGKERYLISPNYYEEYMRVLMIVLPIFGIMGFVGKSFEIMTNIINEIWIEIFFRIFFEGLFSALSALVSIFGLCTIIFAILDYKEVKKTSQPWTPERLPQLPKETDTKISRRKITIDLIVSTIFGATFVLLLSQYQKVFGWYDNGVLVVLLFNPQTVSLFIPFLIASIALNIIIQGFILYKAYWSSNLAIVYTCYKIAALLVAIFFIWHPQLISDSFITYMEGVLNNNIEIVMLGINSIKGIVTSILTLITIISTTLIWYKLYKAGGLRKTK